MRLPPLEIRKRTAFVPPPSGDVAAVRPACRGAGASRPAAFLRRNVKCCETTPGCFHIFFTNLLLTHGNLLPRPWESVCMLKRKALQIVTLIAAVVLLSAYVVYSQLKQSGTVASSSKSIVLTNRGTLDKTNPVAAKPFTNSAPAIRPASSNPTNSSSPGKKPELFFPGSKSSAVFTPQSQATGK
jgi:hypothetical protein